ncbi:tetratricopeptide repeat protein [candidate division WOR-3 bacterium]|nr:tetratricopeptide repeat protein [candidate division WOR-3 bacterium]
MKNLIPRFIHNQYRKNIYHGEFDAATMFVDISGFTSITEKLMGYGKRGAETLSFVVNRIFNVVIDSIYGKEGYISSFGGDSFTAIFPSEAAKEVSSVALDIQKIFSSIFRRQGLQKEKYEEFRLSARIGLSFGKVEWGIVGHKHHRAYFFKGEAVESCIAAAKLAKPGEIIMNKMLREIISPKIEEVETGFFKLDVAPAKARRKNEEAEEVSEEIVSYFTPEEVISSGLSGEFRDVVSIFVSFRPPRDFGTLDKFITSVLDKADNFGGYFNGLDFADKGPTVFVLFGAPQSFENNIERALDFMLALREESDSNIRAGLSLGSVYAGIVGCNLRCTYTVLGDTVNTAARFMSRADWGKIWVSDKIKARAGRRYKIDSRGALTFKGKSKPVEVFELLGRSKAKEGLVFADEMVGRKDEFSTVKKATAPALKGKFGGVVYVYGEAGIGKTRLLYELSHNLGPKFKTFFMTAEGVLHKSMEPFINVLRNYFGQSDLATEDENKGYFERTWKQLSSKIKEMRDARATSVFKELTRTKTVLGGLLGLQWQGSLFEELDAKGRYENTLFAIKEFFKALSLLDPVCFIIEDIQWLDADSHKVVATLTRKIDDFPIIIFASSRLTDDGAKPVLTVDPDVSSKEVLLEKLDPDHVAVIIQNQMGKPVSQTLAEFVLSRTEGNPFYIQQFCRYLEENKLIELKGEKYVLVSREGEIPEGIKSILVARLDRLSVELKETVQTASVLGMEFDINVLSTILKERDLTSLLLKGETETLWSSVSEIMYIFKHALLRDAAYNMQLRSRLRRLHLSAAEAIERLYAGNAVHYADLAFHYENAETTEKASEYLRKAGDWARENCSNEDAIHLYDRLLKYIVNEDEEIVIRNRKGEILQLVGRWDEAADVFRENLQSANELGNKVLIAESENNLAELLRDQGAYSEAFALFETSYELYIQLGDQRGMSRTLDNMGSVSFYRGNYEEAMKYYEGKLAIVNELGDALEICKTESSMGTLYANQGDYVKARDCFEKYLESATERGDKRAQADALGNMGGVYFYQADYERAFDYYQKKRDIAEALGDKHAVGEAIGNIGFVFDEIGDYDKALKCYQEQLRIAEELGDKRGMSVAVGNMGNIYYYQGAYDRALEFYKTQLKIANELNDRYGMSIIASNVGVICKDRGEYKKAEKYFDKAIEIAKELQLKYELSGYFFNKADLYYMMGDMKDAVETNNEALNLANEVKRDDIIFRGRVLGAKVLAGSDKKGGVAILENMMMNTEEDSQVAELYYELFKATDNNAYRMNALDLYREIYRKTPNVEYKRRVDELERG